MPTLRSGKKPEGGYRSIKLTDSQMEKLGFSSDEKPEVLGCGTQACAYLPNPHSDAVVKISKDHRDALAAYMIMNLPGGTPQWAIPIHAVYRLPDHTFVLVTTKADPLPEDLADAIDEIYEYAYDDEVLDDWPEEYAEAKAHLKRESAKGENCKVKLVALEAVNEAVMAFRKLGLDWADFHSGNWMIYNGRPVVVDFGMSVNLDEPPVDELNERMAKPIRRIPVLEF